MSGREGDQTQMQENRNKTWSEGGGWKKSKREGYNKGIRRERGCKSETGRSGLSSPVWGVPEKQTVERRFAALGEKKGKL